MYICIFLYIYHSIQRFELNMSNMINQCPFQIKSSNIFPFFCLGLYVSVYMFMYKSLCMGVCIFLYIYHSIHRFELSIWQIKLLILKTLLVPSVQK